MARSNITLEYVLNHIQAEQGGLLGAGSLSFLVLARRQGEVDGYIVFTPDTVPCTTCGGKGMESWSEPFSQSSAAVCPDCLGDGFKKPG
jgi:hypothetical protein